MAYSSKHFLIAPDKFKGSLSAFEACDAITKGIRQVIPSTKITSIPLADGGDGTGAILSKNLGAKKISVTVHNPLKRKVKTSFGLKGKTAYLDFASASGLAMIPHSKRNPMKATSRGVGELMQAAVKHGAKKLVLGIGGSATVDGGIGAMKALGIQFLDFNNKEVSEGGQGLLSLYHIDLQKCAWKKKGIELVILADVTNPLLGKNGSARIFGPQKGATPRMIPLLERGLKNLNKSIIRLHGKSVAKLTSGGASGGVAAGFFGILGAVPGVKVRIVSGIDYILDVCDVASAIKKADWIFTGEGRLDSQTAQGKTIGGLTKLTRKLKKPVIAFTGKVSINKKQMRSLGLVDALCINPQSCSLKECFRNAEKNLVRTTHHATKQIIASNHYPPS